MNGLGELERAVMEQLWASPSPLTVRQVHENLAADRDLAYTTVMTVLQRLARKRLVIQRREDRAHRYSPAQPREDLVAALLVDALGQAPDSSVRTAALVRFIGQVSPVEARAMREALRLEQEPDPPFANGVAGR
ncbi:transcriptional repressor, CopY family [Segniliparus rotundus DSM 44985]|uniref:Transcriptional repressor, CopY family n=1 Tax=Segniliparus rotundus (strain ATCC BAA-972 / CDC 1076 / CIP 108378 / DSM 44985 / JCM 13578) TaxID=640132 RepID=D6Z8G2_SEGRD|nr:BlaI/MecI/CopY family transcriptional regulator [Segniliparus rotundus]ADG98242.1 transcriptional repressor, CopY family [Segniliparus rotundus DSM 44985]